MKHSVVTQRRKWSVKAGDILHEGGGILRVCADGRHEHKGPQILGRGNSVKKSKSQKTEITENHRTKEERFLQPHT